MTTNRINAFATVYHAIEDQMEVFNNPYFKIDGIIYEDEDGVEKDFSKEEMENALDLIICVLTEELMCEDEIEDVA